jgi:2-polyprenyl-6-hydroxyphenyl methylase/3-demethylubiquinone-9 3-methyltransferase
MSGHKEEVDQGKRFQFGKNWQLFLRTVDDDRIEQAVVSLRKMLGGTSLEGKRFLDVGSGSGLFSLAARRLGAEVCSFDFDPNSVACTAELRKRYSPDDSLWSVLEGSILDSAFVKSLQSADVVYSWGVLHHTGEMWRGLDMARSLVRPSGLLYIALYNDQGATSVAWNRIKQLYCRSWLGRIIVTGTFVPPLFIGAIASGIAKKRNPLFNFREYRRHRGMSIVRDWIDWLGGFPFEVARPEQVLDFLRPHGFELQRMTTTNRLGCNEYVFERRV